jgi:hypothetical protein
MILECREGANGGAGFPLTAHQFRANSLQFAFS